MNFDIKDIVTWGGMALGLIGVWYRNQFKIERLSEKDSERANDIKEIWRWKSSHEKDATIIRETLNKEIAELRGASLVTNEQFKQIMNMLQDIKERITKLENGQQ